MSRLELRRFSTQVLRDRSSEDDAQVPAAGATLEVIRPSAIVREQTVVTEQEIVRVPVRSAGGVLPGESLVPWLHPSDEVLVTDVDAEGAWVEVTYTGYRIVLEPEERLVPRYSHPALFAERTGTVPLASPVLTLDEEGRAEFYCAEARFDCVLSDAVLGMRLIEGCEGGWARGGEAWIDAKDYPTIQAAIDALPAAGGTVFIPAGTYSLTATLYTPCDRPCHLLGEGAAESLAGGAIPGTVLQWSANVGMLRLRGDHSSVRRLVLENVSNGVAAAENEGYGIAVGRRAVEDAHPHPGSPRSGTEYERANRTPAHGYVIEDVHVARAPGWGLYIPGVGFTSDETTPEPDRVLPSLTEGGTLSYWVEATRLRVWESRRYGLCFVGRGCTTTSLTNCAFLRVGEGQVPEPHESYYAYVGGGIQVVFSRCTFEGWSPKTRAWVRLWGAQDAIFDTCWFEQDPLAGDPANVTYFLNFANRCLRGSVRACHFVRPVECKGMLKLVQLESDGATGLSIENPSAVSGDRSHDQINFKDPAQIDLGGHYNFDTRIIGSGGYSDLGWGTELPIQYFDVPSSSFMLGKALFKLPAVVDSDVNQPDQKLVEAQAIVNGNMVMNWGLAGAGFDVGCAMYRWGGAQPGWRLFNNVPSLTLAQRDARQVWVQGDMIYNLDQDALEIRVGTTWRTIPLPAARQPGIK